MSRGRTIGRARRTAGSGFTIVELLIATLIFSVVLILITVGVLTFTKVYFKGLNQSKTQEVARSVVETISQSIQFSGSTVTSPIAAGPNGSQGFCIADKRFSYLPGWQLQDEAPDANLKQARHALVMDEAGNCSGLPAQDMRGSPVGTELLAPGMRVSELTVKQIGATPMYNISIRIAYGEEDLLYSPKNDPKGAEAPDAICRFGFAGAQFCATAELTTIVNKRISQTP